MATYLILGMIKYDHETVRLEDETDEEQEKTSRVRNMFGGLIENNTVCLGYAQILKNILSEFGIDSRVVIGIPNNGEVHTHAWNVMEKCIIQASELSSDDIVHIDGDSIYINAMVDNSQSMQDFENYIARLVTEMVGDNVKHPDRYETQVDIIRKIFESQGIDEALTTYFTEPHKLISKLERMKVKDTDMCALFE